MDKKVWIPLVVIGGGALAFYLYRMMQKKKEQSNDPSVAIAQATIEEQKKFTPAFLAQYDILMPPVQASKAVKEKAIERQDKRAQKEAERRAKRKPVRI